jgi:thiol-disulfide isomerase/thioredoxin
MAAVESTMLSLGTKAPTFHLLDVSGACINLHSITKQSKGVLIIFICNHCPYVKYINKKLVQVAQQYIPLGISFIAINSNDTEKYPSDSFENMIHVAKEENYGFPYLFDENQEVAKAYQAACTPDFYLFDESLQLVYRGQFDKSRPGNEFPVSGEDVTHAINNLLHKQPNLDIQIPSVGCNIKWKAGNEPDYFFR